MTDRAALAAAFLSRTGWGHAARHLLAGDASSRRYDRLRDPASGASAVLMDAPPATGEDIRSFTRIARHLHQMGLSSPRILGEDSAAGFLLLEDLGDDLFARVIRNEPALEAPLYAAATDLLLALHRYPPPPGLTTYDPRLMTDQAALAFDWYLPGAGHVASGRQVGAFRGEMETVLAKYAGDSPVMILRDFHAENLLWLPERRGVARIGLLDFQDAMGGHPAYDLVSLLQDVRRDVASDLQTKMLARYLSASGQPEAQFRAAYAALGAQRSVRILGIFSRLCIRDHKPQYVDLIPRVWGHLQNCLSHPALAPLQARVAALFPTPTTEIRQRIKDTCKTAQMQ